MPGINVTTTVRPGPSNPAVPESGRYFVAGIFERGPVDRPQLVRNRAELEDHFGAPVGYSAAYDDLRTYFEEGGAEAYALRVVGPTATTGTATIADRAGTPIPTLKVDAASPGGYSAATAVRITDGRVTGTVAVEVLYNGGTVERYDNLTDAAGIAAALTVSRYVRGTDLGSLSAGNAARPAVGTYTLSAGNDQRGTITAAVMGAALDKIGPDLGAGAVAIPGYAANLVGDELIAHAKANRRIALLATAIGQTEAQAIATADTLVAGGNGEYAGLFYPWVRIPTSANTSKLISPEGYVAAARARAHRDVGPWRAAAGEVAEARYVLGPEVDVPRAVGDRLDDAGVNAIRTIAGTTRVYGWRSLSADLVNFGLLTGRDTLNTVAVLAEDALEPLLFQPIDALGHLYGKVESALLGIVEPMRAAQGLYPRTDDLGQQIDPGYSVDVGPTVNNAGVLAANRVGARLGLRVSPVGTIIDLTIVKTGLAASV